MQTEHCLSTVLLLLLLLRCCLFPSVVAAAADLACMIGFVDTVAIAAGDLA